DIAGLFQSLAKCAQKVHAWVRRCGVEEADDRHRRLLRPRRERPYSHRAAEERYELAAFHLRDHSITSSARASSDGGTVRPIVLAVWALMTSSNLLACTTGRSAGFAPLRMRPA